MPRLGKKYHHGDYYLGSDPRYQVHNIIRVTEHKHTVRPEELAKLIEEPGCECDAYQSSKVRHTCLT